MSQPKKPSTPGGSNVFGLFGLQRTPRLASAGTPASSAKAPPQLQATTLAQPSHLRGSLLPDSPGHPSSSNASPHAGAGPGCRSSGGSQSQLFSSGPPTPSAGTGVQLSNPPRVRFSVDHTGGSLPGSNPSTSNNASLQPQRRSLGNSLGGGGGGGRFGNSPGPGMDRSGMTMSNSRRDSMAESRRPSHIHMTDEERREGMQQRALTTLLLRNLVKHDDDGNEVFTPRLFLPGEQFNYNLVDSSLCGFPPMMQWRRFLFFVIDHVYFERVIMFFITLNLICMMFDTPNLKDIPGVSQTVFWAEVGFQTIFTIEMCLKIFVLGFFAHPHSYLRSPWNFGDFLIVLVGFASFFAADLAALRLIRVLRLIRALSRAPLMHSISVALIRSAPRMADVMLLMAFVVLTMAIFALQLLVGSYNRRCYFDVETTVANQWGNGTVTAVESVLDFMDSRPCGSGPTGRVCQRGGVCREFTNTTGRESYLSFDNIGLSIFTTIKIVTMDNWPVDTQRMQDAEGFYIFILSFAMVIFGGFFCLNLVLAILSGEYEDATKDAEAEAQMPEETKPQEDEDSSSERGSDDSSGTKVDAGATADPDGLAIFGNRATDDKSPKEKEADNMQLRTVESEGALFGFSLSAPPPPGTKVDQRTVISQHRQEFQETGAFTHAGAGIARDGAMESSTVGTVMAEQHRLNSSLAGGGGSSTGGVVGGVGGSGVDLTTAKVRKPSPKTTPRHTPHGSMRGRTRQSVEDAQPRSLSSMVLKPRPREFIVDPLGDPHGDRRLLSGDGSARSSLVSSPSNSRRQSATPHRRSLAPPKKTDAETPRGGSTPHSPDAAGSVLNVDAVDVDEDEPAEDGMATEAPSRPKTILRILRGLTRIVVLNPWFGRVMLVVTAINIIALGLDHHNINSTFEEVLDRTNFACTIIFMIEMVVKIFALGLKYFMDPFNLFDCFLVLASIPELVLSSSSGGSSLSALRGFRLARVMRVMNTSRRMKQLLLTVYDAAISSAFLFFALTLFLITTSLIAVTFFDKSIPSSTRPNFTTLADSLLALFIVLTGEDWVEVGVDVVNGSNFGAMIFFYFFYAIGNYLLLNFVIVILIASFNQASDRIRAEEDELAAEEVAMLPGFQRTEDGDDNRDRQQRNTVLVGVSPDATPDENYFQPQNQRDPQGQSQSGQGGVSELRLSLDGPMPSKFIDELSPENSPREKDVTSAGAGSSNAPSPTKRSLRERMSSSKGSFHASASNAAGFNASSDNATSTKTNPGKKEKRPSVVALMQSAMLSDTSSGGGMQNSPPVPSALKADPQELSPSKHQRQERQRRPGEGFDDDDEDEEMLPHQSRSNKSEGSNTRPSPIIQPSNQHQESGSSAGNFLGSPHPIVTSESGTGLIMLQKPSAPRTTPPGRSQSPDAARADTQDVPPPIRVSDLERHVTNNSGGAAGGGASFGDEEQRGQANQTPSTATTGSQISQRLIDATERSRSKTAAGANQRQLTSDTMDYEAAGTGGDAHNDGEEGNLTKEATMSDSSALRHAEVSKRTVLDILYDELVIDDVSSDVLANMLDGKSFFCFERDSRIRLFCARLATSKYFELVVLSVIVLSCIALGFDNPNSRETGWLDVTLQVVSYLLVTFFFVEAVIRSVAWGAVYGEKTYLADNWNRVDFFVLIVSIVALAVPQLAAFRALRAFRLAAKLKGVRVLLGALLAAVPGIVNVLLLLLFAFVVFGILGVQLFKGSFVTCTDESVTRREFCVGNYTVIERTISALGTGVTAAVDSSSSAVAAVATPTPTAIGGNPLAQITAVAVVKERKWQHAFFNFNHVGLAIMTLLQQMFGDGWSAVMYNGIDSTSFDVAMEPNARAYMVAYFLIFMIVGNFFLNNLFVGSLIDSVSHERGKSIGMLDNRGAPLLSQAQEKWIRSYRVLSATKLLPYVPPPGNFIRARCCWIYFSDNERLAPSKVFEWVITFAILANAAILCVRHFDQPGWLTVSLAVSNWVFAGLFALEAMIKICALLPVGYFTDAWNCFDFLLVIVAFISGAVGGPAASALRVLRVMRVLRLVKRAQGLRRLFDSLLYALPQLLNVGMFLLLTLFVFGVIGTALFAKVYFDPNGGGTLNEYFNFQNAGNAMVLLFQISTTESWSDVLQACAIHSGNSDCQDSEDNCGTYWAIPYFVVFMFAANSVALNLFIFVIVDNYMEVNQLTDARSMSLFRRLGVFRTHWSLMDRQSSGKIHWTDLITVLRRVRQEEITELMNRIEEERMEDEDGVSVARDGESEGLSAHGSAGRKSRRTSGGALADLADGEVDLAEVRANIDAEKRKTTIAMFATDPDQYAENQRAARVWLMRVVHAMDVPITANGEVEYNACVLGVTREFYGLDEESSGEASRFLNLQASTDPARLQHCFKIHHALAVTRIVRLFRRSLRERRTRRRLHNELSERHLRTATNDDDDDDAEGSADDHAGRRSSGHPPPPAQSATDAPEGADSSVRSTTELGLASAPRSHPFGTRGSPQGTPRRPVSQQKSPMLPGVSEDAHRGRVGGGHDQKQSGGDGDDAYFTNKNRYGSSEALVMGSVSKSDLTSGAGPEDFKLRSVTSATKDKKATSVTNVQEGPTVVPKVLRGRDDSSPRPGYHVVSGKDGSSTDAVLIADSAPAPSSMQNSLVLSSGGPTSPEVGHPQPQSRPATTSPSPDKGAAGSPPKRASKHDLPGAVPSSEREVASRQRRVGSPAFGDRDREPEGEGTSVPEGASVPVSGRPVPSHALWSAELSGAQVVDGPEETSLPGFTE